MAAKTDSLTIRLKPETRALLQSAQERLPYVPTITSIVERGIVLSLRELDRLHASLDQPPEGRTRT